MPENVKRKQVTGKNCVYLHINGYFDLNFTSRYRDFIIEEAEVDSDVDEDDEYDDNVAEIGIVGNEVEESGRTAREIENRRRIHTLWE